jgi:hypothetical protein
VRSALVNIPSVRNLAIRPDILRGGFVSGNGPMKPGKMCGRPPAASRFAILGVFDKLSKRRPSMEEIGMIGLDTAKSIFQLHGTDEKGGCKVVRQLKRMDVSPPFVKLFVEGRRKSGTRDPPRRSWALAFAGRGDDLYAVPVKSAERQADLLVIKARSLLVRQHAQTGNALRGHLVEFGLTARAGLESAPEQKLAWI